MAEKQIDIVVGVRGLADEIVNGARGSRTDAHFVSTPELAGEWLEQNTRDGDIVLMKASRGVKLEKALDIWKEALGRRSSLSG
jgi:UDP-N-acetylmuramoyl-tripeptide--D-alanyl-D-alanine ligase